jgi:hypothetical protein
MLRAKAIMVPVGRRRRRNYRKGEGAAMAPQFLTEQDEENYGRELIDFSKRAAVEALAPELNVLRVENQQLRGMAQRAQHAEIERALDAQIPGWQQIYADPRFADWLAQPDDYSGGIRSRLMRNAVANGDAARVVQFYRGFQTAAGQPAYRGRSRAPATGSKPAYTREQIKRLYEQRARGAIPDSRWAPLEADIVKAASEGRINSVFDKYGSETRYR